MWTVSDPEYYHMVHALIYPCSHNTNSYALVAFSVTPKAFHCQLSIPVD